MNGEKNQYFTGDENISLQQKKKKSISLSFNSELQLSMRQKKMLALNELVLTFILPKEAGLFNVSPPSRGTKLKH